MRYDIVSLGELLVDFTQSGRSPAGMRLFEQNPGGAVTNLVAAAARCGAKTAFIGKVGADMHGTFLKESMEQAGVDMHGLVTDPDVFTTLAFVALSPSGERDFSFARKPGADSCLRAEELDEDMLQSTRIFHIGSISLTHEPARTATHRAIALAKGAGALLSYDPNYRASLWPDEATAVVQMRSLVPHADLMKLSDEETALLTGEQDPERAIAVLVAQGVSLVAVTLGGQGALVWHAGTLQHIPGFHATVADTTGAGDAFFGGLLSRFLSRNQPLAALSAADVADMVRFGNATASLCVEQRGGIPAMPTLAQVERRMAGA